MINRLYFSLISLLSKWLLNIWDICTLPQLNRLETENWNISNDIYQIIKRELITVTFLTHIWTIFVTLSSSFAQQWLISDFAPEMWKNNLWAIKYSCGQCNKLRHEKQGRWNTEGGSKWTAIIAYADMKSERRTPMCSQARAVTGHTEGFMISTYVISLKDNLSTTHTRIPTSYTLPPSLISLLLSLSPSCSSHSSAVAYSFLRRL